jgi:dTMP kinase
MLRFITLEGVDGSGKTTQMGLLDAHLAGRAVPRVLTREPGDTSFGKGVRQLLLERRAEPLSCEAELFLIAADRAQHVREVIKPALQNRRLVLCDRYADSTLAYQGYGRGLDLLLLRRINRLATGGLMPDLTLLFDCPAEVALSRAVERLHNDSTKAVPEDRFEAEGLEFQRKVREGFLQLARSEPSRFVVIDADAPVDLIHEKVGSIIDERLRS